MTLSAEQLATVVRRMVGAEGGAQMDVEDVVLAERATAILVEEGFDQAKIFKQASEIALAVRIANAEAFVPEPVSDRELIPVGELVPTQEAFL